jgi:hypothetical protein
VINGLDDHLLHLRYIWLCYEFEFLEMNLCAMGGFMLLCIISLVVPMVNFDEEGTNFRVRRLSTHRLFSTPVVPDDDIGFTVQNIVTPVT